MKRLYILLVEDHRPLAETVGEFLESSGHIVDYAFDGTLALQQVRNERYDIIVLDIMLPGMNGYQVCEAMRNELRDETPVIMLTAKDQLDDKLEGFSAGADDYLIKPFDLPELEARIEALVRRREGFATGYEIGGLSLDLQTLEVSRAGQSIKLSKTAFDILTLLMREHPKVVSRAALEQHLWGEDVPDSDALRSHLYTLRQAVDRPFDEALIETLPGRGYRINA